MRDFGAGTGDVAAVVDAFAHEGRADASGMLELTRDRSTVIRDELVGGSSTCSQMPGTHSATSRFAI
jgi:hypothetical protein